ncbi:MAG: flotillin family protein [Prochlorotrichaceae cyanobacterium]
MNIFIFLVVMTAFTGAGINFMIKNLLYICQPSEVLIFSGAKRRLAGGRVVSYRLVKGGKSLRTPLFEKAFRMDLTNTIIELKIANAYSKGGVPLFVEGIANIKIAGEEPIIHNAIERLLDKNRKEIEQIARETLEGNLRGVLASLTPQQVNEDKMAFAQSLLDEASDDLERLGLTLDNLQIQNISDEVSYLNSIGRQQQAELQRDARIAEAQNRSAAIVKSAENERNTKLRQLESETAIVQSKAEQRIQDALTKREALVAEAESIVESEIARTEAEIGVQEARIKQVEQQLQADVIAPAEAACKRMLSEARGNAAQIIEDGKARAEGIRALAKSWTGGGSTARQVFLFQKLDMLLKTLVSTVPKVEVQNVTLVDTKGGNLGTQFVAFSEQLRQTTGLDLPGAVNRLGKPSSVPSPRKGQVSAAPSVVASPSTATIVSPPPSRTSVPSPTVSSAPVSSSPMPPPAPVVEIPQRAGEFEDDFISDFDDFESLDLPLDVSILESTPVPQAPPIESTPTNIDRLHRRIEDLLDRLVLSGATIPQAENSLQATIRQDRDLKKQLKKALKAGGREALEQIVNHPLIRISGAAIEAWIDDGSE